MEKKDVTWLEFDDAVLLWIGFCTHSKNLFCLL